MIEMGTIVAASPTDIASTHKDGRPADCADLVAAWSVLSPTENGWWINDANLDLEAPSGGLFGGAAVVNPFKGSMYSYDARALESFSSAVIHFEPGNELPSLDTGVGFSAPNVHSAFVYDGEAATVVEMQFGTSVDAVSAVFMHDTMMNEYNIEDAAAASSEWVVTFPTKSFYTNTVPAEMPFTKFWTNNFADDDIVTETGTIPVLDGACEIVKLGPGEYGIWDREEATNDPDDPDFNPDEPVFSPSDPTNPQRPTYPTSFFCHETTVVRFGALPEGADPDTYGGPTEIFGTARTRVTNINTDALDFESGWVQVNLLDAEDPNDNCGTAFETAQPNSCGAERWLDANNGYRLGGLPMTGFWASEFQNGFAETDQEGVLATQHYGGVFSHKGTRLISMASTAP
jgi:hypothetical protein